ncbi:conserved hypothetical protein [Klebsiella variicola]|nr:conserved hypothetical protein [Klebsiella variicola]GJK23819.1 hypothetical protein TUM17555_14940 [Klebsiella pneumoniae]CTQ05902.1 conserved hypothetical protein [Klebsiella variicola]CTQ05903.1 conserved hypothetical protein [Klebsiella variicola]CTQ12821.1 conserved hypothetical protein [Klebsiella variicola]
MVEVSLMLLNQTAMSKVWFTFGLVARAYHRHKCHTCLNERAIIRAVYIHLPENLWTPIPLLILDGATFLSGKPV